MDRIIEIMHDGGGNIGIILLTYFWIMDNEGIGDDWEYMMDFKLDGCMIGRIIVGWMFS